MPTSKDERDRILHMIESGQVTANDASQILDTLRDDSIQNSERGRDRLLRIRATTLSARGQKMYVTATLPLHLIKTGLRLGVSFIPMLRSAALEDLIRSVENGATGRLLDLQDIEKGERFEIYVEVR